MYLITTPIEKKFYNELSEFIYQGSWCNDNSEDNSHKIVPYHWSNIHLRHIDLQKIESVYERILTLMTNKLNILHGENYTKEYWRIIIGVWLYSFISTIFDRYKCLLESKKINIKSVFISDYPNNLSILNTFSEFWSKVRTDEYNSLIFSDIVKVSNVLPYKIINIIKRQNLQNNDIVNNKYNETLHELVNKKVLFFNSRLTRKIKLLISTSNHSVLDFFIQTENDGKISFGYDFPFSEINSNSTDFEKRKKLLMFEADNKFEKIIGKMLYRYIPKSYVENYKSTLEYLNLKKYPKIIITANGWHSNDAFKIFCSQAKVKGSKLIILQHGGNGFMGPLLFYEKHQIDICDKYFTWGWSGEKDKVKTVGPIVLANGLLPPNKKRLRKKTSIVYTPLRWSRYSLQTDYGPTISGYNDYIKQQNMFLNCLNNDVSQYLIIKNKGEDFGQNTLQRIVPNGKKFTVIDQEITFQQLMKKAVLHVSTYNGQTHLETMRMNYPTILFWDPDHWLLNKEAAKYHKKLQDVGVFHTTPKSAAVFINHNYRGINDWWFSSEVQSEVDSFVDKYAKRVSSWSMIKKLNLEINNN